MHLVDNQAPGGNQGDDEPLAPVAHMLHFKDRRALMCRGEQARADAEARGFKRVSVTHFMKYIQDANKGFRQRRTKKK